MISQMRNPPFFIELSSKDVASLSLWKMCHSYLEEKFSSLHVQLSSKADSMLSSEGRVFLSIILATLMLFKFIVVGMYWQTTLKKILLRKSRFLVIFLQL